jgi:hypothetical protein
MLDVRLPIGWLFTIFGVLVAGQGALAPVATQVGDQTWNLNLVWGVVMLVFGLFMLWLAKTTDKETS